MPTSDPIPFLSLFCGSGGLDLGFEWAGFKPVLAIDNDPAAVETYAKNRCNGKPSGVELLDLSAVSSKAILERLEGAGCDRHPLGVVGGPPCQAFSSSNVHKRDDDPRAALPESYAQILSGLNARAGLDFFVFENVVGLKRKRHREQFEWFKELFESAGFILFEGELDAKGFGVPQERKRVFVVGLNRRKYAGVDFQFPQGGEEGSKTVREAIGDLPQPRFFSRGLKPEDIPFHPNHWAMRPKSRKFFDGSFKEGQIKGRPFRVLAWDRPSWTVAYGHREVHVHPSGKRRLSVLEAMRLQGFPDSYQLRGTLSDQFRLISDAVPPPVGKALAEEVKKVLEIQETAPELRANPKAQGFDGVRAGS